MLEKGLLEWRLRLSSAVAPYLPCSAATLFVVNNTPQGTQPWTVAETLFSLHSTVILLLLFNFNSILGRIIENDGGLSFV